MAKKKIAIQNVTKRAGKTPVKKTLARKKAAPKTPARKRTAPNPAAHPKAAGTRGGWTWAPARPHPAGTVYQFRVTLLDVHPPIWRQIQVQDCFLDELHRHIQRAMGWTDSHLYLFDIDDITYGRAFEHGPDGESVVVSASRTLLRTVVPKSQPGFSFRYTYDLGDSWEHLIVLERAFEPASKTRYPLCLDGRRACPPENCGGTPGYEHLLCVLHDPDDKEYDELLEWAGADFDPEDFDPKQATTLMARKRCPPPNMGR